MKQQKEWIYDNWKIADETEQKACQRTFAWKASGLLIGYIVFIVLIVSCIFVNIFFQKINYGYIGFFSVMVLAALAGLINQLKVVRSITQKQFELRDGYIRDIHYTNRFKNNVLYYEVEIREHNVLKRLQPSKRYRNCRPKIGAHILLARPEQTSANFIYKILEPSFVEEK